MQSRCDDEIPKIPGSAAGPDAVRYPCSLGAWRARPCRRLSWPRLGAGLVVSATLLLPAAGRRRAAVATAGIYRTAGRGGAAFRGAAVLVFLQERQGLLPLQQRMSRGLAEGAAATGEVKND